jgi:hypothetical protein
MYPIQGEICTSKINRGYPVAKKYSFPKKHPFRSVRRLKDEYIF